MHGVELSVIAIAETSSPLQKPGSQRRFCSGVASEVRYGPIMSLCSPIANPGV